MSITVADCLKLPSLRNSKVIAGEKGLSHIVNSVSVLEATDKSVFDFEMQVDNSDLMLTSFYSIKDNPEEQCRHIENMYNLGDAAVVIYYVGIYLQEIDPSLIETANRLNFPLIIMPEKNTHCFYNEVICEVSECLLRDKNNTSDFLDNIAALVSRLPENRKNINTLLRLISDNLKITVLLSDLSMSNVCLSKWPSSNTITAEEICALFESGASNGNYFVQTHYKNMPMNIFSMPFTAFEYRNFSIYAVDDFNTLTLDGMYHIIEILQIFSKLWNLDTDNILENALIPAIMEGDEKKMYRISAKLGIDIAAINTTVIVRPSVDCDHRKKLKLLREGVSTIKECAYNLNREIIVDTYGQYIIAFIIYSPMAENDNIALNELIETLNQVLSDFTITFFPNDDNIADISKTYRLYTEYIPDVIKIFPLKKRLSYGDILFAKNCRKMIDEKNEDYRICCNLLRPLQDSKEDRELFSTLAAYYLDADCQIKKTAEMLFLHRNTVQYRLNKAGTVCNFLVQDNLDSHLMYTAIACRRLLEQ